MKHLFTSRKLLFYSCLLGLFASCHEGDGIPSVYEATNQNRSAQEMPANVDNPYDATGALHNELLYHYYDSLPLPTTVAAVRQRLLGIANGNTVFLNAKGLHYDAPSEAVIQELLGAPTTSLLTSLNSTAMSAAAKSSLSSYIVKLMPLAVSEGTYEVIYDDICDYETTVLSSMALTPTDKKIILQTTSILRFSIHVKKKRPKKNTDPDWLMWVGHASGAISGGDDPAEAAVTALISGIAQNP